MPENTNQRSGFLIINKPAGMTSHDVVDYVRKLIPEKAEPRGRRRRLYAVGHAGTLDPFATGVLIVAIGKTTRLLEYIKSFPKTYEAEITLGATSDTDDVTGKITPQKVSSPPSAQQVSDTLKQFIGSIKQVPPAYSAVKFQGKKLYEYARAGLPAEASAKAGERVRTVTIYSINLFSYAYPSLKLEVNCGSGTYIRALARDIGEKLGVGSYVSHLRRKVIHKFHISEAIPLDKLSTDSLTAALKPSERLIEHLSVITLSPENVAKFKQGQAIEGTRELPKQTPIAIFDESHGLIGIGQVSPVNSLLHPQKVL